ncbi:MAG: hypothetical protein WAT91_14820 [Saprospiraceae bacterium]
METPTIIGSNQPESFVHTQRAIGDVIAMQLASITYCSLTHNIKSTLNHYLPDWQVVWQPKTILYGTDAFIAYNGHQYVIAIRGSILDFSWGAFENWFEQDFNLLFQQPWIYPANSTTKPMISQGAFDGLSDLITMTDVNGDTILSFIMKNAVPNKKFICTTGHSLGGNLATVYSMYLRYQILTAGYQLPAIFSVLTFAAPTSWNKSFADLFDRSLTNTWRYYNVLDIVPFSACNVAGLWNLYPPPGTMASNIYTTYKGYYISLAEVFDLIQFALLGSEAIYNSYYTTVNQSRGAIPLNIVQKEYPVTPGDPLLEQWFEQAGAQHDHNHYLEFLGATDLKCQ